MLESEQPASIWGRPWAPDWDREGREGDDRSMTRQAGWSPHGDSDGHGQYTVEGEIAQLGSFASGANRRGGLLGLAAKALALLIVVLSLGGLVAVVVAWL